MKRPSLTWARTPAQGGAYTIRTPTCRVRQAHVVVDATRHIRGLFRNEPIFDGKESDRRLKMAATSGRLPRQHPRPYARGLFFFSCQLLANACVAASRVASNPCVRERSSS